jgi:hypothetical protein
MEIYWLVAPLLLPLLMLIAGRILVNRSGRYVYLRVVKGSLVVLLVLSVFGIGNVGVSYLRIKTSNINKMEKSTTTDTARAAPSLKPKLPGCKTPARLPKFVI